MSEPVSCRVCTRGTTYRADTCEWVCPLGHATSEQYAALHRLGPWALPKPPPVDAYDPGPGFVRTGPNSWERMGEVDYKTIITEGRDAIRKLVKRGAW